jgi:hypothetical protein
MPTIQADVMCPKCLAGNRSGCDACSICGYPRPPIRPVRAIIISIIFCATGIFGFALAPLYVRWVGQKGKYSIVTFPIEMFAPATWPKLALAAGSIYLAIHLGTMLLGKDWAGWWLSSYLFVDVLIRLVAVPVHLYRYLHHGVLKE